MAEPALTLTLPPEALAAVADLVAEQVAARLADTAVDPWLNVEQAAAYLAAPRSRVHDLVALGRVRCARDGRRLLFRRAWLDAVVEAGPDGR